MKAYREVIQYGTFYRLASPFDDEECGWMVASDDKKTAIVGAWFGEHSTHRTNASPQNEAPRP